MKHAPRSYIPLSVAPALLMLCAPESGAQGQTTEIFPIVVSTQKGNEVQQELIHKAALSAIDANPQYSYQKGRMAIHGVKPSHLDLAMKAGGLYNEAFTKYDELDIPGAIETAEKALEKLELGAAYIEDLSMAVKILYLIGLCHTLNGNLNDASVAFLRAFTINPKSRPDEQLFPPDVIDVYDAVVEAAGQVGMGSMKVQSNPEGAYVYLDGMPMGVTPVTIDNIIIGKHIIRLSKSGYQFFGTVLTIEKDDTKKLDATLQKIPGASRIISEIEALPGLVPKGLNSTLPSMNTISKDLGVEQLLLVLMTPGEGEVVSLSLLIYDRLTNSYIAQRSGDSPSMSEEVLLPKAVELSKSALVAAQMKEGAGEVTDITPPVVGPGTEEEGKKKKKKGIVSKWWFWVAIVAGAGVAAGGGYLGYAGATGKLGSSGPGGSGGSGDIILEF
jgi:tetratricopeptide (TPR) repeat protein